MVFTENDKINKEVNENYKKKIFFYDNYISSYIVTRHPSVNKHPAPYNPVG